MLTFKTGVRNPAKPSAVPFTELITFCMILFIIIFSERQNDKIHKIKMTYQLLFSRHHQKQLYTIIKQIVYYVILRKKKN